VLRVTVEMVPFGIEGAKMVLGTMEITNIKMYKSNKANYSVIVPGKPLTTIKGFERKLGFWELVYKSIVAVFDIDVHGDCDC